MMRTLLFLVLPCVNAFVSTHVAARRAVRTCSIVALDRRYRRARGDTARVNVDGVVLGNYRCSLAGLDLNRMWKDPSKRLTPTVWHAKQMMRRLQEDPMLKGVSHVIVDEAHERSEDGDFVLMVLRRLLRVRPELKVVLMSATLNAALFCEYFAGARMATIPGRTFPVTPFFLEESSYAHPPISPICRTPLFPISHILFLLLAKLQLLLDLRPSSLARRILPSRAMMGGGA